MCDEAGDVCVPVDCTDPDVDGDGHQAVACGGADCDDTDATVNPGVEEICDLAGVDEDCNPDTLGDTDVDGDGHVSDACCNGLSCGTDCDDSDASIHPAIGESCDGVDNNCSGASDEETPDAPLCPGGTCSGGRCAFRAFDRAIGSTGFNLVNSVDTDAAGNLYLAGIFQTGSDFGRGPQTNAYAASYSAEGVLRWVATFGGDAVFNARGIAVDDLTGHVYITAFIFGAAEVASESFSGASSSALIALDVDGAALWARHLPTTFNSGLLRGITVHDGDVYVAAGYTGSYDFLTGARAPTGLSDAYLQRYDRDGVVEAEMFLGTDGARVTVNAIAHDGMGRLVLGGSISGPADLGSGPEAPLGGAAFVYVVNESFERSWHTVVDSPRGDSILAVSATDTGIYVSGALGGEVTLGSDRLSPTALRAGFVAAYDPAGRYRWSRPLDVATGRLADDVEVIPSALASTDTGVALVGWFSGVVDFGGGGLSSTVDPMSPTPTFNGFQVRYREDGLHLSDRAFGGLGNQGVYDIALGAGGSTNIVGAFEGTIDLGSGVRTAPPDTGRGFVARIVD